MGFAAAVLVFGEALGLFVTGTAIAWLPVLCLALLLALLGYGFDIRGWLGLSLLLLGMALALRESAHRENLHRLCDLRNGRCEAAFNVTDDPQIGKPDAANRRWISFPSQWAGERLIVSFQQDATDAVPQAGERWHCAGWLNTVREGDHRPRRLWVKGRGSFAERDGSVARFSPVSLRARMKRNLSRRMGIGLDDRPLAARLNRAMVLGERAALPYELRQDFMRSGTLHVFAISGLHVMIVAQFIGCALILMFFPIRWVGLVQIPLLWLYVFLIGSPASAVRAAAMASCYQVAPMFFRKPNALTAWEVTLVIFALIDPVGLFGVGSVLSFTVMLGILLFMRWAKPFGSALLLTLGLPFAAWAAGVPIAARVFAHVTPGGLLANYLEVPLAGAAVLTSLFGVSASFVSEALAAHVNNLAALFTDAMRGVSWAVARIPGADLELCPWTLWQCAGWYAGVTGAFLWIRHVWMRRRSSLA